MAGQVAARTMEERLVNASNRLLKMAVGATASLIVNSLIAIGCLAAVLLR